MAKGSEYERMICNLLSDWWAGKEGASVFWRTSNSGGRATVRRKKGMVTSGHCGDIGAVDEVGLPLVRLITIEVKRGYSAEVFTDVFDYPQTTKPGIFEGFISQAKEAAKNAGTPFWMLIHRRDRREPIVYVPWALYDSLLDHGAFDGGAVQVIPFARTIVRTRRVEGKKKDRKVFRSVTKVIAMKLDDFLEGTTPAMVRGLYEGRRPKLERRTR